MPSTVFSRGLAQTSYPTRRLSSSPATTTCFETFPFPRPTDAQREAIAHAAKELDDRRRAWLDPPGADPSELKRRTLTNLYNQRPTRLAQAHLWLDRGVWDAYGWDDPDPTVAEEEPILARLLGLNLARSVVARP